MPSSYSVINCIKKKIVMMLRPRFKVCPDFMRCVYFKIVSLSTQSVLTEDGVNKMWLNFMQSSTGLHKYKKCH